MPLREIDVQRILVVALLPIGDTLFATPTLRALKHAYPDAHLTAVTYTSNRDILTNNPDVDELLALPTRERIDLSLARNALRGLRSAPFDLGIGLNPFLAPAFRAVTKTRRWLHLPLPARWWLTSQKGGEARTTHAIDHYLGTLSPLGLDCADSTPRVVVSAEDRRWAAQTLERSGVGTGEFVLAIHPGGDGWGGIKRWSPGAFAWVAREMTRRLGGTVLLVGGDGDRAVAADIAAELEGRVVNLAGVAGLMKTAAVLEQASLFAGNDSSPLHLAAAVETPAVGIVRAIER